MAGSLTDEQITAIQWQIQSGLGAACRQCSAAAGPPRGTHGATGRPRRTSSDSACSLGRTFGGDRMTTIGRRRSREPYVLDNAAQEKFHRDWNDLSVDEKLNVLERAIHRLERRDRQKGKG